MMDGFSIGELNISNVWHADITLLVADSVEKYQVFVSAVNVASEERGLRNKKEKTDCMGISKLKENSDCVLQIYQEPIT